MGKESVATHVGSREVKRQRGGFIRPSDAVGTCVLSSGKGTFSDPYSNPSFSSKECSRKCVPLRSDVDHWRAVCHS